MGEYELVIVVEAPDNVAAAKAPIGLGAPVNVSTTTMAAFSEDQFRDLISEMG